MVEFDPGPPKSDRRPPRRRAQLRARTADLFWYDWGPVFYRGRLNSSAQLLCIASDPGPTERIACRTLVGDAGQRVQGFLTKLGLTRSYALVNAFAYALLPSQVDAGATRSCPSRTTWPGATRCWTGSPGPQLQAVVAFGMQAQARGRLWDRRPTCRCFEIAAPVQPRRRPLVTEWRAAITELRRSSPPTPTATPPAPTTGRSSPRPTTPDSARDLPFGLPDWVGDDAGADSAAEAPQQRGADPTTCCTR